MPFIHSHAAARLVRQASVLLPLCALEAHAGASLFVDDAAITPSGHCQVESWVRLYSPGQELTAVPACNIANTEFGVGLSHFTRPQSSQQWNVSVKRLFRDFDAHRWGIGVAGGAIGESGTNGWTSRFLNVPISVALDADRDLVLHVNAGWINNEDKRDGLSGGVGLESALASSWRLLAEVYDDQQTPAIAQVGVRRALGQNATLDFLVGRDAAPGSTWFTAGFNVSLPR